MDNDYIKEVIVGVFNHPLKLRPLIARCRFRAVNIFGDNHHVVPFGVFVDGAKLGVNAFFALHIGREAAVRRSPSGYFIIWFFQCYLFPFEFEWFFHA